MLRRMMIMCFVVFPASIACGSSQYCLTSGGAVQVGVAITTQSHEIPIEKDARGRILLFGQDTAWYAGKEAVRIADNMLAYQRNNGGFPERWPGIDYTLVLSEKQIAGIVGEKNRTDSSLDNGTTHTQLRYLARVATATGEDRFKAAFVRGVDYLLAAQQPSGGWMQSWPHALYGSYASNITFNDGAMIGALTVLQNVAGKKADYVFVDESRRKKCAEAVARGVECILKCQIVVDGTPAVWCQQHDVKTLQPRGARSFEPPALCSWESVGIVQFLMQIDNPDPEVIAAIQNAVAWYDKVKIVGKEVVKKRSPDGRTLDCVIVNNPDGPWQWARFYNNGNLSPWPLGVAEIKLNQPIFIDTDALHGFSGQGKVYDTLAAISLERRKGYNWMGSYANDLLVRDYPAWQKKWAPDRNVLLEAAGMIFDAEIGHYKDMSYEALSDEGLSWEKRTRIFGGETVHYGELTGDQRKAKHKELDELLAKIDMKLVNLCQADVRAWLDKLAVSPLKHEGWEKDWKKNWSVYTKVSKAHLEFGSAILFRAYEIWGDEKYLKAGLKRADVFVRDQLPRGNWRTNVARIQDGWQSGPFRTVLYAYKVSGDKKYFESAKKCADCLLPLQRRSGGWPDQWPFDGARPTSSGIIHGMSHNDGATTDMFRMMVIMYHLTGDLKYIANLRKLGPFIEKTNLGEGQVVGWAEAYDDNGRPLRVRQYEFELPYPKSLTRSVGPLLIWLYLIDGDESHMELLKRAYAWHEHVRQKELEPWQLEAWKVMAEKWPTQWGPLYYRPGWPDAYLTDGTNWGRGTFYKLLPWYPVTPEMKKKYGGLIHSSETDAGSTPGKLGYLADWAKRARVGGSIPPGISMGSLTHSSCGNALVQVRRALLEHKKGGYERLLKYYTNPVKYTPDQYLQARVDAAKRAIDARNVRLAAMRAKGVNVLDSDGAPTLHGLKSRWYGPKGSKWGKAYDDRIMDPKYPVNVGWYQWQLVYDTMLAQGRIDADTAARGGRGLQGIASMNHFDSWDVLGEYIMAYCEKENYFDVPFEAAEAAYATLNPVEELKKLNGFAELRKGGEAIKYDSGIYGLLESHFIRQTDGKGMLIWRTKPLTKEDISADGEAIFRWPASTGWFAEPAGGRFSLFVNGSELLEFDVTAVTKRWRIPGQPEDSRVGLTYDVKGFTRPDQNDSVGIMTLILPEGTVKIGESIEIGVTGSASSSKRFFVLYETP